MVFQRRREDTKFWEVLPPPQAEWALLLPSRLVVSRQGLVGSDFSVFANLLARIFAILVVARP